MQTGQVQSRGGGVGLSGLQVHLQLVPITTQVRVAGDLCLPSYPHHPTLSKLEDQTQLVRAWGWQSSAHSPKRCPQLPVEAYEHPGTLGWDLLLAWDTLPLTNLLSFIKLCKHTTVYRPDPYEQREPLPGYWAEHRQSEAMPWAGRPQACHQGSPRLTQGEPPRQACRKIDFRENQPAPGPSLAPPLTPAPLCAWPRSSPLTAPAPDNQHFITRRRLPEWGS